MSTLFAHPPAQDHELYVWNANELLEDIHKAREGAHAAVEMNEGLKRSFDADAVAIAQLIKSGNQIVRQIRLLGVTGRAYTKEVRGKRYIIFKGNARLRPNLKGTRYLAENAKVRCFVVGSKDILKDAMKGTRIAVIAFVVIDIVAEMSSDQPSLASLGVHITSDVLQAVVASAVGYAAGALILAMSPAAPVVVVFIVVVAVGFFVGTQLTRWDNEYKVTERARTRMMAYEREFEKKWPAIRQSAFAAEQRAAAVAHHVGDRISLEAHKVDRYFHSLTEQAAVDAGRLLAN